MQASATIVPGFRLRKWVTWQNTLVAIGVAMLVVWGVVWKVSLHRNQLVGGKRSWVPAYEYLGLDFLNNYLAARHWLAGGNPYTEPIGDPREDPQLGGQYIYPPVVLPLFVWCKFLKLKIATRLWMGVLVLLASLGATLAWRCRRDLGLEKVPWVFALAAILCSTPVLFAVERGNCDLLVLLPLALVAWALRERSGTRDAVAGGCLALAAWIKIYPALLVLALPAFKRYRALAWFVAVNVAFVLPSIPFVGAIYRNQAQAILTQHPTVFHNSVHTLSSYWNIAWTDTRFAGLAAVPGSAVAMAFILVCGVGMSWWLGRCQRAGQLAYPYLLWLAALATFLPPIANDYNFFYLPLAALAVWDRRDPIPVHILMAFLLLWWQPVMLAIGPKLLFAFKMGGFFAVTYSLAMRIREVGRGTGILAPELAQAPIASAA